MYHPIYPFRGLFQRLVGHYRPQDLGRLSLYRKFLFSTAAIAGPPVNLALHTAYSKLTDVLGQHKFLHFARLSCQTVPIGFHNPCRLIHTGQRGEWYERLRQEHELEDAELTRVGLAIMLLHAVSDGRNNSFQHDCPTNALAV